MRCRINWLCLPLICLPQLLCAQTEPPVNYCGNPDLDQGWTCDQREDFWYRTQGSRMLPYTWFLYLEQWNSTELFRSPKNMDALRFITAVASARNPDALPVGFARDCAGQDCWVGLTCAACHTARIKFGAYTLVVDGAPGMLDFTGFLEGLTKALEATRDDTGKFTRFAEHILGSSSTQAQRDALHRDLIAQTAELRKRADTNRPQYAYGFARVDAFGHIFNQVLVHDLGIPDNAAVPNAPVSYPCLWDTPQHDKVQWNGSGLNHFPGKPLYRNIGEALGVFGVVNLTPKPLQLPKYESSISRNLKNLEDLEELIRHLSSPVWPRNFKPIDEAKAARGKETYKKVCCHCHEILEDRKNIDRHIKAELKDVGTDPSTASNFANRKGKTGPLKGTLFPKFPFGDSASAADILTNLIFGVYRSSDHTSTAPRIQINPRDRAFDKKVKIRYKARPLNGVWATAPYLHNGSVSSLWDLLSPKRSTTFQVGSRIFDPDKVGYDSSGTFAFDTSVPGNLNIGHPWGTTLSDTDKSDLIEFLKIISDAHS